jgi:phage tail sheath protein FI
MPEYLSPGVYIEEIPGPQPIQGVSTSTTGMVGVTKKGPTSGKPELVTNFGEFLTRFGGYFPEPSTDDVNKWALNDTEGGRWWLFPHAVKGFFDNGGQRLYVKRVFAQAATPASADFPLSTIGPPDPDDPERFTLVAPANPAPIPTLFSAEAKARGTWGNGIKVRVSPVKARRIAAVNGTPGQPPVTTKLSVNVAAGAATASVTDTAAIAALPANGTYAARIGGERLAVTIGAVANGIRTLQFAGPLTDSHARNTAVKIVMRVDTTANNLLHVPVSPGAATGLYTAALVLVEDSGARLTVDSIAPTGDPRVSEVVLAGAPANSPPIFEGDFLAVVEAAVSITYEQAGPPGSDVVERLEENFTGLGVHDAAPRKLVDVVNDDSRLIDLEYPDQTAEDFPVTWDNFPGVPDTPADRGWTTLDTGTDAFDSLAPEDFAGTDGGSGQRTGVAALEDIEEIAICAIPGIWSETVRNSLITLCTRLRDRFAIVDPQDGLRLEEVRAFRSTIDTNYGALYHPWVQVRDPLTRKNVDVPPSGHIAGVYAQTDVDRGVHKAPANVAIRSITGLTDDVNQREQDVLNPYGINALRTFPNRGRRVWGARTLSSVPEWRYVNVRRLFIFVEQSVKYGTQWVVFEPNGPDLWARVRQAVSNFLRTVWRQGALLGLTEDQAFYVRCGFETMSQDDLDNGRLIVEIGIAPVRPAEFVIFRFQQKTLERVA